MGTIFEDKKARFHAFVGGHRYGVVSSISEGHTPQSALVAIAVSPALEIIFDTLRSTRKYSNFIHRDVCSVVLGFPGEKTMQFEGNAIEPHGEELKRYQELYFSAWPDGRDRMHWNGMTYIVVRPKWLRLSDFDQRPPLIEELEITLDASLA